ncbi:LysR family transcriptional regulator [Kribbella sp. DT2]|uniref:LysR family transcriptional regulator n=1 Tax=Kribbella sp. DT2 TaxID=3393427 RepID=UPI003CEDCE94
MDLNSLQHFLVVARLEHLSRAAEELHIAQPSLSRTIARLEHELGTPLFDRAGRLRLNDAGHLFRQYAERALGELDAGRRAVADATGDGFGTVRVGSETFLTITAALSAYKLERPGVEIELVQLPASEMSRRLRAQEIDLCLASQPVPADGLESTQLLEEQVWLATSLDHPLANRKSVTIDELADVPFVSARPGHWHRRLLDRLFAEHGLIPRIVCEADEAGTLAELISAGFGVGLVPDQARRSTLTPPGALVAIDTPDCRRTLTLYWNTNSYLSPATRQLRTLLTTWPWHTPPR